MKRYLVAEPASFRWQHSSGSWHEGTGRTRNISGLGVYVVADSAPELGALVEVVVDVPPLKVGGPVSGRLHGKGKVLRLAEDDGFAAALPLQLQRVGIPARQRRSKPCVAPSRETSDESLGLALHQRFASDMDL